MHPILKGKKILLGVTGSIAAYKSSYIIRLLVKAGCEVRVIMTPSSTGFITPLTLSTLSKNPVHSDFVEDKDTGVWNNHVDAGLWADLMVIAPATAETLSGMAQGRADNFLLATYLSAKCPVMVAPAMDLDMYKNQATQDNLKALEERGVSVIPAETGELASGLEGKGRMAEPEHIVEFIEDFYLGRSPLRDKRVLISAGPTYEHIDPVRFVGNHSSGRMGYALAEEAARQGAQVTLVSGPVSVEPPPGVEVIDVVSAEEMYDAVTTRYAECDVAIMAAAVSDYTPIDRKDQKIKKSGDDEMSITLKKTKDILGTLGERKKDQFLVGFALETNDEEENAKDKLKRKNLDFIVLNSLRDKGAGFGHDTNKVTIIDRNNKMDSFELKHKREVARDIIGKIVEEL